MRAIGEIYGVSRTVIKRILDENNIPARQDNHTYIADYRKFSIVDSPEKAYWLGFIAADGNVYVRKDNTNATVKVSTAEKDCKHLEKLKLFMQSNVKIKESINEDGFSKDHPTKMYIISFNSIEMAKDLIELGIVPRKSLILKPPKIDEQYFLPYILGYFDGDGSIYKFDKGTEFGFNFVGTLDTIDWINRIIGLDAKVE